MTSQKQLESKCFYNINVQKTNIEEKIITSKELWRKLNNTDISLFQRRCKYLLKEFGTINRCNRFDVGNCIEFFLADWIKLSDLNVENEPNAPRIDLNIPSYGKISVKYSSTGDIKIHNSLGPNKDIDIHTTLILTPKRIYLISDNLIKEVGIELNSYLKNTGDGLSLKRSLLTKLDKNKYFYKKDIDISINKTECKNRICAELVYNSIIKIIN